MQPRMISGSWSSCHLSSSEILRSATRPGSLQLCMFRKSAKSRFLSQGCLCCWRLCATPHTFYFHGECHWHLDRNGPKSTNHLKYGYFSIKFTNTEQIPILEMMVLGYLFSGRGFCHVAQMGLELEAILLPRAHVYIALCSSSVLLLIVCTVWACMLVEARGWYEVFFYCSSYWDWFSLDPDY